MDAHWRDVLRPALRQTIRVLVSVAAVWAIGILVHLQEMIWALITALIVTQSSIVQTLATARDQIRGTVLGGIAGAMALALHVWSQTIWLPYWMLLIPLVFLAAIQTSLRFACITLTIIFLVPSHGGLFLPLVNRLLAISAGVTVSMGVSFLVLQNNTRRQAFETSGILLRYLDGMLQSALDPASRWSEIEGRYQECLKRLTSLRDAVEEARRERLRALELRDPVMAALPHLMRRLINDTLLVARAIATGRAAGNTGLRPLYHDLSHMLRTLAHACEQETVRAGKRNVHPPSAEGITALLPELEEQSRPEMRFVMSLFREDIERAAAVILSKDVASMKGL